ncbi:MAG: TetR/AcrR family transcriptional regulator [Trueperella sp.]|nr:TetR/AcrR family transcriptional regulator [Trueperella sp.]
MPKISAPTVKEHHQIMFAKLVDAAEEILRSQGAFELTAGEVANRVGIARNSIYRYVESVTDLRVLVLERYLPQWYRAMSQAADSTQDPLEQLISLVTASFSLAQDTGYQWLIDVMKVARASGERIPGMTASPHAGVEHSPAGSAGSAGAAAEPEKKKPVGRGELPAGMGKNSVVGDFHRGLTHQLTAIWRQIAPETTDVSVRITRSLMDAGLKVIDEGVDQAQVTAAVTRCLYALADGDIALD